MLTFFIESPIDAPNHGIKPSLLRIGVNISLKLTPFSFFGIKRYPTFKVAPGIEVYFSSKALLVSPKTTPNPVSNLCLVFPCNLITLRTAIKSEGFELCYISSVSNLLKNRVGDAPIRIPNFEGSTRS